MTKEQHLMAFFIVFWPCLALFGVAWGIAFGEWLPALIGGWWLIAAAGELWRDPYYRNKLKL